jgi:hypothetical protein
MVTAGLLGRNKAVAAPAFPTCEVVIACIASAAIPLSVFASTKSSSKILCYRVLWVAAFIVNLITVSLPGRFDSEVAKNTGNGKDAINGLPWKTLFAPAGWAFAIWGVIYVSEILLTAYVGIIGKPVETLKKATPFWVAGNLFQSLWCFVFRPKFKGALWLPASQLFFGAVSLSLAHRELTEGMAGLLGSKSYVDLVRLLLIRFPISLHLSWLFAASTLNLNSWAAYAKQPLSKQVSLTYATVYVAAAIGAAISLTRKDPLVALTFAWALTAVASQTRKDCQVKVPDLVKESLADTEGLVAKALMGVALVSAGLGFPAVRKAIF